MADASRYSTKYLLRRNICLFLVIAMDWFAIDYYLKGYANTFQVGEVFGGPYLGLFDLCLVHNEGGAFGMFGNASLILGVFSVVVCIIVVVYLVKVAPRSSIGMTCGLALIFAGGIGNAVDRFVYGYVIDYIELIPIDFPVFNIADVGVVCGVVIAVLAFLLEGKKEALVRIEAEQAEAKKNAPPKPKPTFPTLDDEDDD